jgi:hypothetical protein
LLEAKWFFAKRAISPALVALSDSLKLLNEELLNEIPRMLEFWITTLTSCCWYSLINSDLSAVKSERDLIVSLQAALKNSVKLKNIKTKGV